ncbi:MAG: hypothetical protein MI807_17940 [Verrucomicrobiales bacterium]|nr:hypothetical protein [Verrucomicrobiales bacterium]
MRARTNPDVSLIYDLVFGRIKEADFVELYGIETNEFSAEVLKLISQAHKNCDGRLVEAALTLGFHYGFPDGLLEEVHRLIPLKWHSRHEDLIGLLQEWRKPESVPAVSEAIELKPHLDYLEYDDYGAYYKKCLWSLVAIGTEDAKAVIEAKSQSEIPELREEAVYRLSKFDEDADWSRNRKPMVPRNRAEQDAAVKSQR